MSIFKKIKALFSRGEKTTLQRQARAGIIVFAVLLAGLVVYFSAIAPATKGSAENYVPTLYDGESFYELNGTVYTDMILMVKQRTRADVASVEIKNKNGTTKLVAVTPGNAGTKFFVNGEEDALLDETNVSSIITYSTVLVTNSPNLGTEDRINEYATDGDLANYGLDDASSPSRVTVTLVDGSSYEIIIGDAQPTNDGYYAMVDGRRNVTDDGEYHIIYSLTTYISNAFNRVTTSYLLGGSVIPTLGNNAYNPSLFSIERLTDGKYATVVSMTTNSEEDALISGESYELIYPKGYYVNNTVMTSYVFAKFAYFEAENVLEYGARVHDPEVYEKYGLDLDSARLEAGAEKCFARVKIAVDAEHEYTVYFGNAYYDDALGAEYRYAYSPLSGIYDGVAYNEIIFTVSANDFEFLTWHMAQFVSARLFFEYITSLDYIELSGEGADVRYTLSGDFMSYHVDVTRAGEDGEVILRNGKPLTFDVIAKEVRYGSYTQTQFEGEFENFRNFFYVLITREYALDANVEYDRVSAEPSRVITIKKTERDNNQSYYRYDQYGNRIVGEDGEYVTAMYNGGFVRCHNATLITKSGQTLNYDTVFYNEQNGRFFIKELDRADSNMKPRNYQIDSSGHISNWTYMSGSIEAEYYETIYTYNVYDVLYDYTDVNGIVTEQKNQAYSYVVPTVTTYHYKILSDGERVIAGLIEPPITETSDGVMIRTSQLDKLYSDSNKVIAGTEVEKYSPN